MSEVGVNTEEMPESGETAPVATAQPQASAGQLLRQAREAAGIDLASLAMALKVSAKKLEALESDRLEQMDTVFLRGLASSVCRTLKIDAAPVLERLPHAAAPRLERNQAGLNTPFHKPGDVAKMPFWDQLSRPLVLAALAVLMGALILIFFPSSEQRAEIGAIVNRSEPAAGGVAESVTPPATPAMVKAPQPDEPALPVRKDPPAPAVATAPTVAAVVTKATEDKAVAPVKPQAQGSKAGDAASADVSEAPRKRASSSGIVVFQATEASWVEVVDANGAIQLSRLVEPGGKVGASGPLPLNVTVGRADVTEVTVRGQPFPLESVTKGGVARFEVK